MFITYMIGTLRSGDCGVGSVPPAVAGGSPSYTRPLPQAVLTGFLRLEKSSRPLQDIFPKTE
jgi:hypothetical protein